MSYPFAVIGEIIDGQWLQTNSPHQHLVDKLLVDSRQLQESNGSLFFALTGLRRDGHQFIEGLYQSGVRAFVVSRPVPIDKIPEANVLLVDDVLDALQKLAQFHRQQFELPVVGITGSNGKTIVKEWLYQLLSASYQIVKSPKSYNSQVGVPLSVWQLHDHASLSIFEAGISKTGEMERLEPIIHPTIGIMTNLGSAHAEGFTSPLQKLQEKIKLFVHCDTVICSRDQQLVFTSLQSLGVSLFSWSLVSDDADLKAEVIHQTPLSTRLHYRTKSGQEGSINIPFGDQASIENALHCLALIKVLDPDATSTDLGFQNLLPVAMRLEALEGINDCVVINDVYNADLESLAVALAFSNYQTNLQNRTIVLSDLLQQAGHKDLYEKVAILLKQHQFKRLFAVGEDIKLITSYLEGIEAHFFSNTDELVLALPQFHFSQELILVKGARIFGLERVSEILSLKRHQTVLEINLAALARNLKVFESHLISPDVKVMAMVKAAAYGSGGIEIARFLTSRKVDYLAVAYLDEGVELRNAGITTPIMVLNANANDLGRFIKYDLELEVYSIEQLHDVIRFARQHQVEVPIHLKVETGMNRLGFEPQDLDTLINLLKEASTLRVMSIFSHLAASEAVQEEDFTRQQIDDFKTMAFRISNILSYRPIWHLANSNAIIRYPDAQFDMVRIGIGMYGIGMPPSVPLEPVHTLKTFVSQIKTLDQGATVGYGRREKVIGTLKIATIGIGYADGLIRKAGNRRYAVVVNGRHAPIVGSICMDMTMIDVTGIKDIQVGNEVVVFGKDPTIDALALAAETIPYEVFTSLSARVKRIYTYE